MRQRTRAASSIADLRTGQAEPIGRGELNRQFVPADEGSRHVLRVFITGSIGHNGSGLRVPLGSTGFKVLPGRDWTSH
ncbi:MAG: hypothetical protein R3E70_15535 [Burkholderiaceae bacterium]